MDSRSCFSKPIPAVGEATALLRVAASVHEKGKKAEAFDLIRAADNEAIREWASKIMGRTSIDIHGPGPARTIGTLPAESLDPVRMPRSELKKALILRDGWNCRFCGLNLICPATLDRIKRAYPGAVNWQGTEDRKHALLRIMAAQFDHLVPYSRGGRTVIENLVMACAPCNYGRGSWTLEECKLIDPLSNQIVRSDWDGLVGKFLPKRDPRTE